MSIRIASLSGALLLSTAAAVAADGCPPLSFSITNTPDNTGSSVLFDAFFAEAGDGLGRVATSTCNLAVPDLPKDGYSVYQLDYRGFVLADDGQLVEVRALHPRDGGTVLVVDGAMDDEYVATYLLGTRPDEELDISTALDVDAGANPEYMVATVESIDLARIGFTTEQSVQASIDQLAAQQGTVIAHTSSSASFLLGALEPVDRPTEIGAFAAAGSFIAGAMGHGVIDQNFSVIGGVANFSQINAGVQSAGTLAAAGLRYVHPLDDAVDLLAEAGAWGSPNLSLEFSRQYLNSGSMVDATGSTTGSLAALYARAGVVYRPIEGHELSLLGSLSHSRLSTAGYTESGAGDNLFAATVPAGTATAEQVKATLAWTGEMAQGFRLTLSGAAGYQRNAGTKMAADVAFVGTVGSTAPDAVFVEYGAKLGWDVTPNASLEAFTLGTAGPEIGSEHRFGGALTVSF